MRVFIVNKYNKKRYVVTYRIEQRKITRELLLATFSSIYLGLGFFFMMLNFGLNL